MKRFVSIFLVITLCLISVFAASCSNDNDGEISSESEESEAPEMVKLKVGTYNIATGKEVKFDFSLLAKDIVDNGLDIVGIQEVDQFCYRSNRNNTIKLLQKHTGMEYVSFFKCINYDGGEYGTAILSKYPIIETDSIELNDGSEVERRVLAHAKIDVNGTEINFFNTHLTVVNDDIRASEFQIIKEKTESLNNCILVGDFNVDSYEEFGVLSKLSFINNPDTGYITHPKTEKQIDNICYSSEFSAVEGAHGIFQANHSDHVLLYAELQFEKAKQ